MLWWWLRHITLKNKLAKKSPVVSKFGLKSCLNMYFPEKALRSLFWFDAVYRSTKQDRSPSTWGNNPAFDLGCRNYLVLRGMFHFFLLWAKPLQCRSFMCSQSGATCDWFGCSERSVAKLQGCSWNLLLPGAMFWLLLCLLLPSVTIWSQVSSSRLRFLPVLILFLSWLAISAILIFQLWPCISEVT